MHGATLLTLFFYAYVMHAKVEIAHPVFAVIYQEVCVLCACELISFGALLATGIELDAYFSVMFLQGMAMSFHQWTWLVVTYLRCALHSDLIENRGDI